MFVQICDMCGKPLKNLPLPIPMKYRGKLYRLVFQVRTGNGRWNHLWKNSDCCGDCLKKHGDQLMKSISIGRPSTIKRALKGLEASDS